MSDVRPKPLLAAWSLGKREIVRFFRQRNRIVGAVGTPLLFWLLFGAGFHSSFRLGNDNSPSFGQYSFPGSVMLIVMFTAIFTTISVIEDRKEGFLQSVLVSPIPSWAMVLGKIWGGALIAVVQAMLFLPLSLAISPAAPWTDWIQLIVLLIVAAAALTSLGFAFAWNTDSTQGFHAIMNLVLMPLWLLSGGFFPAPLIGEQSATSDVVMHWGVRLNPLSYAVAGVRRLLFDASTGGHYGEAWVPSLTAAWGVTLLFAIGTFTVACLTAQRRTSGDLL